jgi:DNA topoisomerase-6 subunit A
VSVAARKNGKAAKPQASGGRGSARTRGAAGAGGPPRGKTPAKAKRAKPADNDVTRRNQKLDGVTVDLIRKTAGTVHREIRDAKKPDLSFPVRSLKNVSYSQKTGYFEMGRQKKVRTLTVNTVKSFAQTLRMMGLSKELVEGNDFATKRDAYYQSKNWEEARFDDQSESDTVMDDIEALFSVQGLSREQLRFIPDEHGGAVAGRLVVLDPDRETGVIERID